MVHQDRGDDLYWGPQVGYTSELVHKVPTANDKDKIIRIKSSTLGYVFILEIKLRVNNLIVLNQSHGLTINILMSERLK